MIGQVIGVHLDESAIVDGVVDTAALNPVARLGGPGDYSALGEIFKMTRPGVLGLPASRPGYSAVR